MLSTGSSSPQRGFALLEVLASLSIAVMVSAVVWTRLILDTRTLASAKRELSASLTSISWTAQDLDLVNCAVERGPNLDSSDGAILVCKRAAAYTVPKELKNILVVKQ